MAQKEIEVILFRQLAATLQLPVFIVDTDGALVFFNEAAERLLGIRYEESGEIRVEDLAALFSAADADGQPIPSESMPLYRALTQGTPAHGTFAVVGIDQVHRKLAITAFPLNGQGGRKMGAVAIFWETR